MDNALEYNAESLYIAITHAGVIRGVTHVCYARYRIFARSEMGRKANLSTIDVTDMEMEIWDLQMAKYVMGGFAKPPDAAK